MDIPGIPTGYVEARLAVTTNDGSDDDARFDTIAPSGTVYLKPRRNAFTAESTIVLPDTMSLPLDSDGYATVPDGDGNPTDERRIELPAVEEMTWTASFDLTIPPYPWQSSTEENILRIKPFDIPVEKGKTTQIGDYLPLGVDPSTGATWIKGDKGDSISSAEREGDSTLVLILDTGERLPGVELPASDVAGPPGPSTTLTVGEVTTGEAGSDAEVTITGESPDQKVSFVLPRGDKGDKGDDGAGIPKGGEAGQVPIRTEDGGSEWASPHEMIDEFDPSEGEPGLLGSTIWEMLVGPLTDASRATPSPKPDRIVKRDGNGRAQFTDPDTDADAATKGYVDTALASVPSTEYVDDSVADVEARQESSTQVADKMIDGSKHLWIGDSISSLATKQIEGRSYTVYAPAMSGGRLFGKQSIAASGNRSDQQLSKLDTLLDEDADFTSASVLVGTNDLSQSVEIDTWKDNVRKIVEKLTEHRIEPILMTLPPRSGPTHPVDPEVIEDEWNAWLKEYAYDQGILFVDVWKTVTDPSTREYRDGYYDESDGVHPNGRAQLMIAQEFIRKVGPHLRGIDAGTIDAATVHGNDPLNLVKNPVFTEPELPDGWNNTKDVASVVADGHAPGGYAVDFNLDKDDDAAQVYPERFDNGISGGKTYRIVVLAKVISASGVEPGDGMNLLIRYWTGDGPDDWEDIDSPLYGQNLATRDYLEYAVEVELPSDAVGLTLYWRYTREGSTSGKIHSRLGGIGVFDASETAS